MWNAIRTQTSLRKNSAIRAPTSDSSSLVMFITLSSMPFRINNLTIRSSMTRYCRTPLHRVGMKTLGWEKRRTWTRRGKCLIYFCRAFVGTIPLSFIWSLSLWHSMALPWPSAFFLKVLSLYSTLTLFSTQISHLRSHSRLILLHFAAASSHTNVVRTLLLHAAPTSG